MAVVIGFFLSSFSVNHSIVVGLARDNGQSIIASFAARCMHYEVHQHISSSRCSGCL